jgi:LmbE family N-acetylglucosaminyl deacetylase
MRGLQFATTGQRLSVLCLGAHSDDIEIGAGASILGLIERGMELDVHWCVLSASGNREKEARAFLNGAKARVLLQQNLRLHPGRGRACPGAVQPADRRGASDGLQV